MQLFLSCKCFIKNYFIGMATRESHHAYFCILKTLQISKDLRVCLESPKKSSYPFPAMDLQTTQIISLWPLIFFLIYASIGTKNPTPIAYK